MLIKARRPAPSPTALAATARPPGQFVEGILVKDGANVHVIPVARLDYLEAQDDYVAIHTEGKSQLKPQTLAEAAAGLDPARFVRIARLELYAKDSRVAILKDGKQLPVSRAGYGRLKELIWGGRGRKRWPGVQSPGGVHGFSTARFLAPGGSSEWRRSGGGRCR